MNYVGPFGNDWGAIVVMGWIALKWAVMGWGGALVFTSPAIAWWYGSRVDLETAKRVALSVICAAVVIGLFATGVWNQYSPSLAVRGMVYGTYGVFLIGSLLASPLIFSWASWKALSRVRVEVTGR